MGKEIIKILESYFDNYVGLKENHRAIDLLDLPVIAVEITGLLINKQNNWFSPIEKERKEQIEKIKEIYPHFPHAYPLHQYLNGLLWLAEKGQEINYIEGVEEAHEDDYNQSKYEQ